MKPRHFRIRALLRHWSRSRTRSRYRFNRIWAATVVAAAGSSTATDPQNPSTSKEKIPGTDFFVPPEALHYRDAWSDEDKRLELLLRNKSAESSHLLDSDTIIRMVMGCSTRANREEATVQTMEKYLEVAGRLDVRCLDSNPPDVDDDFKEAWPVYTYGKDRWGRPVIYNEIFAESLSERKNALFRKFDGKWSKDRATQIKSIFVYFHASHVAKKRQQAREEYGGDLMMFRHVKVYDVRGVCDFTLLTDPDLLGFFVDLLGDLDVLGFETLDRLYLVNAPMLVRLCIAVVRPFVQEEVMQRMCVCSPEETLNVLSRDIDPAHLPVKYGGKCESPVPVFGDWKE